VTVRTSGGGSPALSTAPTLGWAPRYGPGRWWRADRWSLRGWSAVWSGGPSPTLADAEVRRLTLHSLRWLMLVAIGSRLVATVPATALNRAVLGPFGNRVLPVMVLVIVLDAVLIGAVARWPDLIDSAWLFVLDVAFGASMTVVVTLLLRPGTWFVPGADAMTGYAWGTIALWTAVRGWRVGVGLVLGMLTLQIAMAQLNGAPLDHWGWHQITLRLGYALMNLGLAAGSVALARRAARLTVIEGARAGQLAERAVVLRSLHDTVLAELEAIVLVADRTSVSARRRLAMITDSVQREVTSLREGWTDRASEVSLTEALAQVTESFAHRGLIVCLSTDVASGSVAPTVGDTVAAPLAAAMTGAVREALNNVVKHAGVNEATVQLHHRGGQVVIDVVDRGVGFRPGQPTGHGCGFGLDGSLIARMREAGGHAEIISHPSAGTRVRLSALTGTVRDATTPMRAPTTAEAQGAVRWFPLAPLLWRMVSLPLIVFVADPALAGHLATMSAVAGALAVVNLGLVALAVRGRARRVLTSPWMCAADFAVAWGWLVWAGAVETPGLIMHPNADAVWTYIGGTVALWMTLRGTANGLLGLTGSLGALYLGLVLGGGTLSSANWLLFVDHVLLLAVPAGYTALVLRMARQGARRAVAESVWAGQEAERVELLTGLRERTLAGLEEVRTAAQDAWRAGVDSGADEPGGLPLVRRLAMAAATDLREALRADSTERPGTAPMTPGLVATLKHVVHLARRQGVRVEFVPTGCAADPPAHVTATLASAVEEVLTRPAARSAPGVAVMSVSASARRVEVVLRRRAGHPEPPPCQVGELMRSIGGTVAVQTPVSGGSRLELAWYGPS
jgi:signal transduction histidine kinase